MPVRVGFLTAVLSESSSQGTSIDLLNALTLLLSRMDTMESNIAVTKTNNLQAGIILQEQDKVPLHPDSSEYQRVNLGEVVRSSSKELRPVNKEIHLTVGKEVRDQAETMLTLQVQFRNRSV